MDLTRLQKRKIAAVSEFEGFRLIVDEVVRSKRDHALALLKLIEGRTPSGIVSAAANFVAWDTVYETLKNTPAEYAQILKEEKDEVYG